MNRVLLCFLATSLSLSVLAGPRQNGSGIKTGAKHTITITNTPVTEGEAQAVFRKMEKAMKTVLNVSPPSSSALKPNGTGPITRDLVVVEFAKMYDLAKPKFRFMPTPVQFDPKRLTIADAHNRASLEKLIRLGFVAKVGPLAAGTSPTISALDFGDAIGFFMARMAELTHTPSTKWSPYLQKDR